LRALRRKAVTTDRPRPGRGRGSRSTARETRRIFPYESGGTRDTSFDGDGILTADFHGKGDFGQDLALDSAGRIVAAGYAGSVTGTEFALMRALP
jgi:hypothetical protein